jgi:hypothetical protein
MAANPTPVVFIPALLSDDAMYRELIEQLGETVEAQVMVLSEPTMQANVGPSWPRRRRHSSWQARPMVAASRLRWP